MDAKAIDKATLVEMIFDELEAALNRAVENRTAEDAGDGLFRTATTIDFIVTGKKKKKPKPDPKPSDYEICCQCILVQGVPWCAGTCCPGAPIPPAGPLG